MKSYWIVTAAMVLMAWPASSNACVAGTGQITADEKSVQQSPSPNSSPASASTPQTASSASAQNKGSYLLVELSKTLKANKLKPGDKVKAEVSQDVISHGRVIIPAETEVIGRVTEVNARDATTSESRLGLVFDRIVLKHYHDITFQAVVQAVKPPVVRRSRVDEPSQMLPPSMIMGDLRGPSPNAQGRSSGSNTGRATGAPSQATGMSGANAGMPMQAPLTVKESPSTNLATGSSAATLANNNGGTALSVGMPQGVFGLKGLSLTTGASTPGPVIVSNTGNVKLESGTQILLHVLSVETPAQAKK
jgi:hypothetical protein